MLPEWAKPISDAGGLATVEPMGLPDWAKPVDPSAPRISLEDEKAQRLEAMFPGIAPEGRNFFMNFPEDKWHLYTDETYYKENKQDIDKLSEKFKVDQNVALELNREVQRAKKDPIEGAPLPMRWIAYGANEVGNNLATYAQESKLAFEEVAGMWDEARETKRTLRSLDEADEYFSQQYGLARADGSYLGNAVEGAGRSVTEYALVGATTGGTAVLPYLFANESRDAYYNAKEAGHSDTAASGIAATHGAVKTAIAALVGKVLGAGVERGVQSAVGKVVAKHLAPVIEKMNPSVQKLTTALSQGGAEGVEEFTTELANTAINTFADIPMEGTMGERLMANTVGGVLGGTGAGTLGASADVEYVLSTIKKQADKTITEVTTAATEAQNHQGPPPRTDRNGFKQDTGITRKTSQAEREAYAAVVKANDEFAKAQEADNPAEPQAFTPTPLPRMKSELRGWTDDTAVIGEVAKLAEYDVRIPDQVLNLAKEFYQRDKENYDASVGHLLSMDVPWKQLIRDYQRDPNRELESIPGFDDALKTMTYNANPDGFVQDSVQDPKEQLRELLDGAEVRFGEVVFRGMAEPPTKQKAFDDAVSEVMQGVNQERVESGEAPFDMAPATPTEPEQEPNMAAGVMFPRLTLLNELPKHIPAAKRWLQKSFGERGGVLGKNMDDAKELQAGEVAKHARRARYNEADLKRALKSNKLTNLAGTIPQELRAAMDDVLKGANPDQRLPADVVAPLQSMRDHVDALSRELLASGAIDPESELAVTIDENMGFYINRIYRKHHKNAWVQEVMENPELRSAGIEYLREQFPEAEDTELQARLEVLLSPNPVSDKVPAALRNDRKFLGILKKRQNLDDTLRTLYGEYRDPFVNYTNTISKMATLVSSHRMGENMKQIGMAAGLFVEPGTFEPGKYVQIDGTAIPMLRGLDGLYTMPEVKAELESQFSNENMGKLTRWYLTTVGYTKAAKTVLAVPRGAIRNFLGNPLIAMAAGNSPLGGIYQLPRLMNLLRNRGDAGERAYIERLTELGVIEESVQFAEVKDLMRAAEQVGLKQEDEFTATRLAKSAYRKLAEVYQGSDVTWKVAAFESYKQQYAEAYPNLDAAALEAKAADTVRSLYPTYSRAKQLGKWISRAPLTGDFAMFSAEIIRTWTNALRLGKAEFQEGMTTGNTALQVMGAKKLAGAIVAPAVSSAISAASMLMFGISDEEDEDRRLFRPFWQENAPIFYAGETADGEVRQLDLGYMDPYQIINRPFIAMGRRGEPQDRMKEAMGEGLRPFAEGSMLTTALAEAYTGHTNEGKPIYSSAADEREKSIAIARHILTPATPSVLESVDRIRKAIKGETNQYTGKQYNLMEEAIAAVLSRSSSQNIPVSFGFSSRGFKAQLTEASGDILAAIRQPQNYSVEQLVELRDRREAVRQQVWQQWSEMYSAAIRLGMNDEEAKQILQETAGKENADKVIANEYEPYRPSKSTLRALQKQYPDRVAALWPE